MTAKHWKFVAAIAVMVVTLSWLAFTGIEQSKSYYVKVSELSAMKNAQSRRLRVEGTVVPGSIQRTAQGVHFVLEQNKSELPVVYTGSSPLPDTFVSHADAIATGRLHDGTLEASIVQAKCASKYEPKGARQMGRAPRTSTQM